MCPFPQVGTHNLFSASADRSVKIWSMDEHAYVDTLFGHRELALGHASVTPV